MKKLFLFCIAIFLGFLFSTPIISLAKFLFETVPFMMVYHDPYQRVHDRINIVGIIWLICFGVFLAKQRFKPIMKWKDWIRNIAMAGIIIYLMHQITDGLLTFVYLIFGLFIPYHAIPRILFALLGISYVLYYVYIKNVAGIRVIFTLNKKIWSWIIIFLFFYVFMALLNVGDYSAYQGWDRIWRFWLIYPANYLLVSLSCLSITKKIQPIQNVKEYYINGEKYDWVTDPKALEKIFHSKREKEIMNAISKLKVHSIVLDVGCGTGLISRHLGNDVLGVDINRWNVEHAKVHSEGMFMIGDCENLPVKACLIDLALCNDVLEHLPNPALAISEIKRVLKFGGILIVTVPSKSLIWKFRSLLTSTHPHSEPYHRNFSKKELLELLREFRVVELKKVAYGLEWLIIGEKNGSDRDNSSFE